MAKHHTATFESHVATFYIGWATGPGSTVINCGEHATPELAAQAVADAGYELAEVETIRRDMRSWRDAEYPTSIHELGADDGYASAVPIKALAANVVTNIPATKNDPATVRILGVDDEEDQEALGETFPGDYMDGCPSILLRLAGKEIPLTWAEAYNLGRALIDKANEAFYG